MTNLPCVWRHCRCTHDGGCVAGWLEDDALARAVPCPTCRPELAHALADWIPRLEPDGRAEVMDGVKRSEMLRTLLRPSRWKPSERADDDGWTPSRAATSKPRF